MRKFPDDVIAITPLAPMTATGDSTVPQFRYAMQVRAPSDVAKYVRTSPCGVVVFCLWAGEDQKET